MQTFLPYPGFLHSARSLDRRRLGKQRVETLQVLRGLTWPRYGWRHHPTVKMWAGYEEALLRKDPDHYGPIFGEPPSNLPYVWPASDREPTCRTRGP
jgi:hypothetical protein